MNPAFNPSNSIFMPPLDLPDSSNESMQYRTTYTNAEIDSAMDLITEEHKQNSDHINCLLEMQPKVSVPTLSSGKSSTKIAIRGIVASQMPCKLQTIQCTASG
jgi:hypothetical protein